jgi:hypothetical protein
MPFDFNLVGACEYIRREAEDLAGSNYAFTLGRMNGALDFVTSPDNGGIETELITAPGSNGSKLAQLRVLYDQRTRPCQASTSLNTNVCTDTGITPVRKQFFKNVGKKISSPVRSFTSDQLAIICKGSKEFIQSWLINDLRATRERLNEVLLAEINAMVGKNYGWDGATTNAGAYKNIQLLLNSNGQDIPQPANYVTIEQDFKNMQLTGVPAIIGAGYFDRFMRLHNLSCCNGVTPYGEAVLSANAAYFYDHAANAVLGNNRLLVLPFGVVHMVTFNENENIQNVFGKGDLGTEIHTTIPDPAGYPITWNFDMKWDCNTKTWKYMYSVHWDIFNVYQTDSFSTDTGTPDCTDELIGMTGVFGYAATRG